MKTDRQTDTHTHTRARARRNDQVHTRERSCGKKYFFKYFDDSMMLFFANYTESYGLNLGESY